MVDMYGDVLFKVCSIAAIKYEPPKARLAARKLKAEEAGGRRVWPEGRELDLRSLILSEMNQSINAAIVR